MATHSETVESGAIQPSMAMASTQSSVARDPGTLLTFDQMAFTDIENQRAFKADDSDGRVAWTAKKLSAAAFMAMFYTGAQIPVYFTGAVLSRIAQDFDNQTTIAWLPVVNPLAVAAICPFVGYLQDLYGKRYIALAGAALLCTGCLLFATAHQLAQAMIGMIFAGVGAGVGELTGLAGVSETVSVRARGYYVAALFAFLIPFCPYVMYAELFSTRGPHPSWRWGIWISLIYNSIALIGLAVLYFPRSHPRAAGMLFTDVARRMDSAGGILSIVAITLILIAFQAGGSIQPWTSAYVLACLIIGVALFVAWIIWEWRFAKYPMVPKELFQGQRVVVLALVVAFIAGMNFLSLLNFWPLAISKVWEADPIAVGLRGLPVTICVFVGAVFWNATLSLWKGGHPYILFVASLITTVFGGALASMTPDNIGQSIVLASFAAFGVGGIIVPTAVVAMLPCPDALVTTCAALTLSVRAIGATMGYAIYYNVFVNRLSNNLPRLVGMYAVEAGLPPSSAESFTSAFLSTPMSAGTIPGVDASILAQAAYGAQWAYAMSLQYVWYVSIAFGVCAMICSLCIPDTRKYQTHRIAVAL